VAEAVDGIDEVACCWNSKGSHGTPRAARFSPGPPASWVQDSAGVAASSPMFPPMKRSGRLPSRRLASRREARLRAWTDPCRAPPPTVAAATTSSVGDGYRY